MGGHMIPKKRKASERKTISVPEGLQKRMQSFSWVNWSAVATRAFEETLKKLEKK